MNEFKYHQNMKFKSSSKMFFLKYILTPTIQPHQISLFYFFLILNLFAIVSTLQRKFSIFPKLAIFFNIYLFKQIYFQVKSFFR